MPGESARQHNLSTISGGSYLDVSTSKRDHTTVRIRGKNSSYAYVEGSFAHPLYSMKNETARKNAFSSLQQQQQQHHHHNLSTDHSTSPRNR